MPACVSRRSDISFERQDFVILLELIRCGVAVGKPKRARPIRDENRRSQTEKRSIELRKPRRDSK